MEIPTATIHRLLSSIREGTTTAPPAPPFPSVADAVAAFEPDASPELLCGRCGAAGGLLRGAQSALCVYCGSLRRGEGDGIAFRGSAAYQWLLGSLRLDGSALVEFDGDSTDSNKSKEKPKSGLVLSDLLDLKLTSPPENREISGSSTSSKQPSVACTLNFAGVNLDSFSIERKKEIAATAAALPPTHAIVQEKHSRSHESSSSDVHITSKGFDSFRTKTGSQSTNQMEATTAFANWDAHFQSTGSESVVGDSKQLDLFKSASVAEPSNFPVSGTAIRPVLAAANQTNIDSEDLASALNVDNLFIQKAVPAIVETNVRMVAGNSVAEFTGSSLDKNSVESSELSGRSDIGVSIDEGFDDWQEFAEGGNQGTLSNVEEHAEMPLESNSSQIKGMDPLPVRSMESPDKVSGDSDDWQAFAQSSAQGDSAKPVEGSSSGQGGDGSGNPVAETSISLEHSLEAHAVDLWPVGNVKEHNSTEVGKQTDDSFDDWQDFTTPGQAQVASFNEAGQLTEVSHVIHREIDVDSWFTENSKESRNTDLGNRNIMLDDWQGFAGSDQIQQSSCNVGGELMDISFEQLHGTGPVQLSANASSNKTTNIVEDNTFDIWQDVAAPRHQQKNISNLGRETTGVSSVPAKEIDSMDLWLTSNMKESNSRSKDVSGIHDSPDKWQDFASFGQAQGNMKIPVYRQFVKDPSVTEPVDLWSSSHKGQFKNLEQINANNDPLDDWQDFKNFPELETGLQGRPGAPLSDEPSVLTADMTGLEFGSFAQSAPSQCQVHKQDNSNEANAAPPGEHERMSVIHQIGDVGALSATSHDGKSRPKSEAGNANVEKLLSQMHDLSFMLKDELSIPSKSADRSES